MEEYQEVNNLPVSSEDSWETVTTYLPGILLDAVQSYPSRPTPWIETVAGTLLLSDISGFTRLSEGLAESGKEGAERLTDIMNEYFRAVLDIARSYGGANLKFGGDALLLFFHGDDHAARAVATAAAMRRATQQFVFRLERSRIRLNMTIGLNSGIFRSVAAGVPERRMQHFILGEEVSHVARLQASAVAGEILLTAATNSLLEGTCITEPHQDAYRFVRLSKRIFPLTRMEDNSLSAESLQQLLAYAPPPVVQSLNVRDGIGRNEGEHRKVVISFINLLGINELLAEKGEAVFLEQFQSYLTAVVRLAGQYHGFLVGNDIYTNGIKLIIVFGAPVAHEQDSANALRFAMDLNRELSSAGISLTHRIGINSGFVFAGDVGAPYRREYTVMGDAVNLSARLMSASSAGQIMASGVTIGEAGPSFMVQPLTPIRVKGKKEPIPVSLVQGERQASDTLKREDTMVGREAEVAAFQKLCQEIEGGRGRTIVISGNPGIGKSRLLAEFKRLMENRHWSVHHGAGYSYSMSKPFGPWLAALNSLFHITDEDTAEERSSKTLSLIKELTPEIADTACLLNSLLGIDIPMSDLVRPLDEGARRRRFLDLLTALFQAMSRKQPAAVVLEDLHWADSSSFQLINHLSRQLGSSRFLLCLTHRPRQDMPLATPEEMTVTFAISELPKDTALQLVGRIVGKQDIPESIARAIIAKAQGNPLFLEEIAFSLRQSGVLDRIQNTSSLQLNEQIAALNIPDRVQSLIMSRIDMLDAGTRQTLRLASVIGDSFDLATLTTLTDRSENELLQTQLTRLSQHDLALPETGTPEPAYHFKHSLIREIAYDSLSFSRRRNLHQRVAEYMENRHRNQIEHFFEVLAYHYSQSRDRLRTRLYTMKSARKAQRLFSHAEATEYYLRSLNTVDEKGAAGAGLRSFFTERIADCYEASGNHSLAVKTYLQSARQWKTASRGHADFRTLIPENGDALPTNIRDSVLQHKIAVAHERNSEYEKALKRLTIASRLLPPRHPTQSAKIAMTRCLTYFRKGQYDEAIKWGRLGLDLSRRTGDKGAIAYAYDILATSYLDTGQIKKAIRYRELAIPLYEEMKDLSGQTIAVNNLGASYQLLGDQNRSLQHYKTALAISEKVRNIGFTAVIHNNVGEVLNTIGDTDEAISEFRKVIDTYKDIPDPPWGYGLALVNLSRAYQRKGDFPGAFDALQKGAEVLRKTGAKGLLADAQLQEAELLLATSQLEAGVTTCRKAMAASESLGAKPLEARGLHILGRLNMAMGKYDEAEEAILNSISLAEQLSAGYEKALAMFYLARLYATRLQENNNSYKCPQNLNTAISFFDRMGARADFAEASIFAADLTSPQN